MFVLMKSWFAIANVVFEIHEVYNSKHVISFAYEQTRNEP